MLIDRQTLSDLEIFKDPQGGEGIFGLLDRTITAGGKYKLREKFLHPFSDINQISEVQHTISFLLSNAEQCNFTFTDNQLKSVERYISSNINPLTIDNKFKLLKDSIKFYTIDRAAYKQLKAGIYETVSFVDGLEKFFKPLNRVLMSLFLISVLNTLDNLVNDKNYIKISQKIHLKKRLTLLEIYKFDSTLRHGTILHRLKTLIDSVYEVDAFLSISDAAREYHMTLPEIINYESSYIFKIKGLRHLFLMNQQSNDIAITSDKNFVFLTGPNMAGKTTFLKSLAIAVYLAHLGMPVPADSMRTNIFNGLITGLSVNDDILKGYSYFMSEVRRIKFVAELLNKKEKLFVLFDELFKGTNVKDAFDASLMIIEGFVKWNNSLFILSSHLSELEGRIKKHESITLKYFESEINDGKPVYSYKLRDGISNEHYGMHIIKQEKIMELLAKK